jgi:hypothetical protein
MANTEQIIKEQLVKLPEDVRKAISSVDLRDKIKKIAEKHHLHIDQAGDLETETVLVMLGLEPTDDYKRNIKKALQISDTPAHAITFDVNKEIFMPIRESLKKAQEPNLVTPLLSKKEIHHPPLSEKSNLVTGLPSNLEARLPSEESEDIKEQIRKQQTVKPSVAPPTNLPTQQESNLEARPLSGEKKPSHIDPYREPIE